MSFWWSPQPSAFPPGMGRWFIPENCLLLVMSLWLAKNRTTSRFSFLMGTISNRHQNAVPGTREDEHINYSQLFLSFTQEFRFNLEISHMKENHRLCHREDTLRIGSPWELEPNQSRGLNIWLERVPRTNSFNPFVGRHKNAGWNGGEKTFFFKARVSVPLKNYLFFPPHGE